MALVVQVAKDVKVDYTQFAQHLAIYALVMRKSMARIIQHQAGLFAIDMCNFTPPFSGKTPSVNRGAEGGFGSKALKKGKDAVSRDVRKIFQPLHFAPAASVAANDNIGVFSAWARDKMKLPRVSDPGYVFQMISNRGGIIGQGEFDYFKRIMGNTAKSRAKFIMGANEATIKGIHEQRRGKPSYKVTETVGKYFVDDWKAVERYIRKVQTRVGKLKSGWYAAGKKLRKMPTSSWIANQGANTSIYRPKLNGSDPTITLGSTVGRNYSQGYHFMRYAMNHRAFAMRVAILKHLKDPKNQGTLQQVISRLQGGFTLTNTP